MQPARWCDACAAGRCSAWSTARGLCSQASCPGRLAQARREALSQGSSVQADADRSKRAVAQFVTDAGGNGKVEAFTVIFRANGEVEHGVVMLRTEADTRTLARVSP